MRGLNSDILIYSTSIECFYKVNKVGMAFGLFYEMLARDLSTQMAGKLVFSLDRNLIVEGITSGNFIQFEMQFQDFKLSVDGEEMIDLSAGIRRNVPLVEITLGSGVDSPIFEMEADVTPLPTVSSIEENNNQKSITIEELPSQPEIGSSSSTPVVNKASKNKMKNYLRRVRKKVVKARKTAEAKALKHVKSEVNQKFVAPSTNPFHGGNHFHPSPIAQRREVVETRARSSIHLLDYYMARINQARTEQTPAPGPRPPVEGLMVIQSGSAPHNSISAEPATFFPIILTGELSHPFFRAARASRPLSDSTFLSLS
ncbi:hypothetical protein IEQ34_015886 [Dendrobium chrysotoxum]|uniref:Uncharacterized protein n=1 Tax=Dendrobium chrysotoxum TaxID=161865 RepID=A0AAV7GJP3_DENCH|nr:hypothetical protein IEQ34_015886 [Dendrobium chrysotoxum]